MIEIDLDKISKNELATILIDKDKEIERLQEENLLLKASEPMSKLAEDYGYKAEAERLNNIIVDINKILNDDDLCHIEKLQKINKALGSDKE